MHRLDFNLLNIFKDLQNSFCIVFQYTVLPAKSDSDVMFCLKHYKELIIDSSLVY